MGASVFKINGTGAGNIITSLIVPPSRTYELVSVTCQFSAAPTTAGSLTITLNARGGAAYDVLLYTVDPSTTALTDIVWWPDSSTFLEGGDAIDVAYTNTDTRTYGVQITAAEVG